MTSPLHQLIRRILLSALPLVLLLCPSGVRAQISQAEISKIDAQLVSAPAISYSGAPGKAFPSKKWMEIETTFSWYPPQNSKVWYSDDLVFHYYVLLNNAGAQYPKGALLYGKTALSSVPAAYLDPRDKSLKTVIYISPRSLERLFNGAPPAYVGSAVTDIGVTITEHGQVIAQRSLRGSTANWWDSLEQVRGVLMNKYETPFAPLNWDYYETVKRSTNTAARP